VAIPRSRREALSVTQRAALRAVIARYDRAVHEERSRWGDESASFVAAKGVEIAGIDYRTLHALRDRGLIRLQYGEARGESLRRGAFGRWTGGTRTYTSTIFFAAPTQLGRETA
jgi:hypothetical protein